MATLLPLLIILIGFWFLMIRPQQRRQAQLRATIDAATPGTQVMLTSGIYGVITERDDVTVMVEIAQGVTIKIVPAAIGQIIEPGETPDETSDETSDETPDSTSTDTPAMFAKPDSEEN